MSGSVRQWIRNCSIVVADAAGRGIEFGQLRIVFRVVHEVATESPKSLMLRAFNVAPNTAKVLGAKEFDRVILKVGYGNGNAALATIFEGDIKQTRTGRMNATDTYVDILGASSDVAYNYGFISKSLAAGYSQEDANNAIAAVFGEYNIQKGNATGFQSGNAPRGRVMWGLARQYARDLAYTNNTTWGLADGQYDQVPVAEAIPDEAIVVTSSTGMIGTPQQTTDGIVVRTLLNPAIKGNRLIKLDNKSIQEFQLSPGYAIPPYIPPKNNDGTYKVIFVDHTGDTRGQEWYSEFVCTSIDASAAPSNAVIRAVGYNH